MAQPDPWSNPSAVGAEDAARMAAFLETRACCPDQVEVNLALCDALSPRPGEHVLEVGCGSGALCRLIAPAFAGGGRIVGVDVAPDMIAAARRLVTSEAHPNVCYEVSSGDALRWKDAVFDAAFGARLMLHTADPRRVVGEMARVVRPGGRVVLMDWDFETVAVTHPDRDLTRRLLHWRCDHYGGDNWSGRKLAGYLLDAGLRDVATTAVATVARDETAALTGSLFRAAEVARDGCAVTVEEYRTWVEDLRRQIGEGRFVASIVYFVARGERGRARTGGARGDVGTIVASPDGCTRTSIGGKGSGASGRPSSARGATESRLKD